MAYTEPKTWTGVSQSTNQPHGGAFIVYINGIEVPVKSVSQRYGVWQIPEMQIEMVADPVLTRLGAEDRVQVVVFYLDDIRPSPQVTPQFRLYGEGEIVSWGYQNTPGGRSIVFSCVNQIAVLTQLFVQFLTQLDNYVEDATTPGKSATTFSVASSSIVFPLSLFTEGLLRTSDTIDKSVASPTGTSTTTDAATTAPTAAPVTTAAAVIAPAPKDETPKPVRVVTSTGAIHIWSSSPDEKRSTVVYVHGYYVNSDQAVEKYKLFEKFKASGIAATFIVVPAPSKSTEPVLAPDLGAVLAVAQAQVPLGSGQVVAIGHSGAFRTISQWLGSPQLRRVALLDGLYPAAVAPFTAWGSFGNPLFLIGGKETGAAGKALAQAVGQNTTYTPVAESHMEMVENDTRIPMAVTRVADPIKVVVTPATVPATTATATTTTAPTEPASGVAGVAQIAVSASEYKNLITRPFDFLFNVVKAMMTSNIPQVTRTIPAANFFVRWARLTNFVNRFVAMPYFDENRDGNVFPVLKALQNVNAIDVLVRNLLPQMQNAGSLFDMLQIVYQQVFMEVAMVPMMPLVRTDLKTSIIEDTPFEEHLLVREGENDASRYVSKTPPNPLKPNRIANYFAKPQLLFGIPPSCNVIFPSQLKMIRYDENYATQPTRLYFNDETVNNLFKSRGTTLGTVVSNALSTGYPPEVDVSNQARLANAGVNGKNFLLFPEEFFKGPVMDRRVMPPWLFFLAQAEQQAQVLAPPADAGTATDPGTTSAAGGDTSTTAATAKVQPQPTGKTMITAGRIGHVGADGQRVFSTSVEKLRPLAIAAEAQHALPRDFLLAWVQHESSGKLTSVTKYNERGYFQIMGPHRDSDNVWQPLEKCEAGKIGLTIADTGETWQTPVANARLTNDSDFSFNAGVQLVVYCRDWANRWKAQYNLPWPANQGDMCRLTKGVHGAPAHFSTSSGGGALPKVCAKLGRPPKDWEEFYHWAMILHPQGAKTFNNATAVGGVAPGASGSMQDAAKQITSTTNTPPTSLYAPTAAAPTEPPLVSNDLLAQLKAENESVYQLYAKYEYFRERYSRRSGSAIVAWNPYVVPGFPAAFFDARSTRVDLFAYITTVQHRMSQRERATDITFVYGRTIQEVFDLLSKEYARENSWVIGSAPREPIRDIRKVIQNFTAAEDTYRKLFYGDHDFKKDAAFDWRKILAYAPLVEGGAPEPIVAVGRDEVSADAYTAASKAIVDAQPEINATNKALAIALANLDIANDQLWTMMESKVSPKSVPYLLAVAASSLYQAEAKTLRDKLAALSAKTASALASVQEVADTVATGVTSNIVGDREIVPTPTSEPMFRDYDSAMAYNWRPICTLDEYIIFHDAAGENAIPPAGHPRSLGARYFERIRRMTPLSDNFTFPVGADGFQTPPEAATQLTSDEPIFDASRLRTGGTLSELLPESAVSTLSPTDQVTLGVQGESVVKQPETQSTLVRTTTPTVEEGTESLTHVPGITSGTGDHGVNSNKDFPQTRADWDKILIAYRNNVYFVNAPRG